MRKVPPHIANGRWLLIGLALVLAIRLLNATDFRGHEFRAFTNFSTLGDLAFAPGQLTLTSSEIESSIPCDELVVSWNAALDTNTTLKVEARAIYPGHTTRYYCLGLWSVDRQQRPRESVLGQKDAEGDVATDTLILRHPAKRVQLKLTLWGGQPRLDRLKFLGVCFTDTKVSLPALPPNDRAWGITLPVPERSQMSYPNGNVICSPTTVSMMLAFWAKKLHRPELDEGVPTVANSVYDTNWKGTGNWVFNMAYAGSFPGMRAYVTRMSDISELEDWVMGGLPVGLSLSYDRLRGRPSNGNGHLVVCVGFTEDGDPVINDPGTSKNVRKVFPRENLISAWEYSRNAAYLVYPIGTKLPPDRFWHWESPRKVTPLVSPKQ